MPNPVVYAIEDNWTLYDSGRTKRSVTDHPWRVIGNTKLSPQLHIIKFANQKFTIKTALKGISWLGKHYYITGSKKKPYTTVMCLSDEVSTYRRELIDFYNTQQSSNFESMNVGADLSRVVLPEFSETLAFGIKPYAGRGALSNEVCSAKKNRQFILEGPFGIGLDLHRNFTGKCVMIGFGTGILPFLDIFDLLLRKSVFSALKKKEKYEMLKACQPLQDFDSLFPGAEFTYYGAFKQEDDFCGADWISWMYDLNRRENLGIFDAVVRLKNASERVSVPTISRYIDREFFESEIVNSPREVKKLIVCATDDFMRNVSRWCDELGFPKGRLHFV